MSESPFGINRTKRYTSEGAERELFVDYPIGDLGTVKLVSYMGGDSTVERVATAGHGAGMIRENPSNSQLFRYLASRRIAEPFKSVQLKLEIQAPIETALTLVYDPTANVNEYSGRYSIMINEAEKPSIDRIIEGMRNREGKIEERAQQIRSLFIENRRNSRIAYDRLIELDMARELARSVLGTDNATRFYWKNDLNSIAELVKTGRARLEKHDPTRDYIEQIAEIAANVAPEAWRTLINGAWNTANTPEMQFPRDNEIVDKPLNPSEWGETETKRKVVPELEKVLFSPTEVIGDGQIQAVDYMDGYEAIPQAARTSYGKGTKTLQDDINLIRSLVRDRHSTPLEMVELAVESKVPVFVDPRQAGRHRTLDKHGFMGFYPVGDVPYIPTLSEFKYQDRLNRQGRGKEMDPEDAKKAYEIITSTTKDQKEMAQQLRELGAPESIVRQTKGVGFFTRTWRTGDLSNWCKYLGLRLDSHAQMEIREFAKPVAEFLKLQARPAMEAMRDYVFDAMSFSAEEQKFLRENPNLSAIDLETPDSFKGHGWVIPLDREDPTKGKKLTREGDAFRRKLRGLIVE